MASKDEYPEGSGEEWSEEPCRSFGARLGAGAAGSLRLPLYFYLSFSLPIGVIPGMEEPLSTLPAGERRLPSDWGFRNNLEDRCLNLWGSKTAGNSEVLEYSLE